MTGSGYREHVNTPQNTLRTMFTAKRSLGCLGLGRSASQLSSKLCLALLPHLLPLLHDCFNILDHRPWALMGSGCSEDNVTVGGVPASLSGTPEAQVAVDSCVLLPCQSALPSFDYNSEVLPVLPAKPGIESTRRKQTHLSKDSIFKKSKD